MCEANKEKRLHIMSAVCLLIFSGTFLAMPISNYVSVGYSRRISVIIGIVFWLTGIAGYSLLIYLYKKARNKDNRKIHILENKYAAIADVLFFAGVIGFALIIILNLLTSYLAYFAIFIIVLSINGHLIFNINHEIRK